MKLLTDEKVLLSSDDRLILTNFRVVKNDKIFGKAYHNEIFLENISSVESQYKSYFFLLILALASLIAGMIYEQPAGGIIIAAVLGAVWWSTRKHLIRIKPNGGASLDILVGRMTAKDIDNFLFNLQDAVSKRKDYLYSKEKI